MNCDQARNEISSYVDETGDAGLRPQLEEHFRRCARCSAVLDGTRNVIRLLADERAMALPEGFSDRLRARIDAHIRNLSAPVTGSIALGITPQRVPLGSHLVYFWENDAEFQRGVAFLEAGLGTREHCILQGHDEAIEKALAMLRAKGFNPEALVEQGHLTILPRSKSAQGTLADIESIFEAAMRAGAPAIRFLGNLGRGRDPLPAGEDDVVELERQTTAFIARFPCVLICMYDVRTLPGRLVVKAGLENHPLTVCHHGMEENQFYVENPKPAERRTRMQ
jgi:hypothetical protein